jgi:hypothetical protein
MYMFNVSRTYKQKYVHCDGAMAILTAVPCNAGHWNLPILHKYTYMYLAVILVSNFKRVCVCPVWMYMYM